MGLTRENKTQQLEISREKDKATVFKLWNRLFPYKWNNGLNNFCGIIQVTPRYYY